MENTAVSPTLEVCNLEFPNCLGSGRVENMRICKLLNIFKITSIVRLQGLTNVSYLGFGQNHMHLSCLVYLMQINSDTAFMAISTLLLLCK